MRKLIGALMVALLGIPLAAACVCADHDCCAPARSCCAVPEERGPAAPLISQAPPPLATDLPIPMAVVETRASWLEAQTETTSFSMRLGLVAPRSVGRAPPPTDAA